nr:MAG TPA: hypothetical protein [Bacteriophage sp.]
MGTNFFAVLPVKERTINKLQGIVDALKKNPSDISTLDEGVCDLSEEIKEYSIHLGKRSCGWVFLWDANELKYYEPTLSSIKSFIDNNKAVIEDEYGRKFTWEAFIKGELKNILYDSPNLYTSEKYTVAHPEEKLFNLNYSKEITMLSKYAENNYINPKYHDFITTEGLRVSLNTNFS